MAFNNRIYKYTCDICKRSIERLADPTRPDPLRCIITDQCDGKLTLVNTRFGLRPVSTPTVIGLLDRVKRGTPKVSGSSSKPLSKVSLSSNGTGGLTLAMLQSVDAPSERVYFVNENGVNKVLDRTPLAALLPANVTISAVLFELTPPALEYKRHTYVRTERCVYVQGKDDSAAQNQLAFDVSSNVRVFVNGLLLSPDAYDKTVQGTITFTPELNELSLLIEVFVYKSLTQFFTEDAAIRLDFSIMPQYDPLRIEGAWGDAQRASQYTPLYCVDTTALDRSRAYGLVRFEARDETDTLVAIDAQGYFLLASPPYAFQDKRLTAVVPVTALTAEGFSLSFAINGETGETNAVIDGETLQPLVRPLALTILDTIKTSREADKVGLIVTREEKTFIIGPA